MQDVRKAIQALSELDFSSDQRFQLIEAILELPRMDDLAYRQAIVHELPQKIRSQVDSEASAKSHAAKIVRTSLEFPGGLLELYKALKFHDGGSKAFGRLNALLLTLAREAGATDEEAAHDAPAGAQSAGDKKAESCFQSPQSDAPRREAPPDPRRALLRGMEIAARAVEPTLGPLGRPAVLQRDGPHPLVTTDGYLILSEIELEPSLEGSGAKTIVDLATELRKAVGDGMTTAAVLAFAMSAAAVEAVSEGNNPVRVKKGIELAVARTVDDLASQAVDVRNDEAKVGKIATAAAGDEEIGTLVAMSIEKVGFGGATISVKGQELSSSLDIVDGIRFGQGYASAGFVNNSADLEAVVEDTVICLVDQPVFYNADIVPVLELVVKLGRPFTLFAADVAGEALNTLVLNRLRGTMPILAVKMPVSVEDRAALFHDLAVLTKSNILGGGGGRALNSVTLEDLGFARRVIAAREETTVVEGRGSGPAIVALIGKLKRFVEAANNSSQRAALQERLRKIAAGVAVIRVGGATEEEIKSRSVGFRKALLAARAAIAEGVVPGGGMALLRAQKALDGLGASAEEQRGVAVVRAALERPLALIARNAGFDSAEILTRVRKAGTGYGFNARTGAIEELAPAGILDPKKVTRLAVERAAAIAVRLITTEILTTKNA